MVYIIILRYVLTIPAVELGLSVLEAGGNFADGIIAYEGITTPT